LIRSSSRGNITIVVRRDRADDDMPPTRLEHPAKPITDALDIGCVYHVLE
jgi:hypothetical protein